jgi:hypothetical protein
MRKLRFFCAMLGSFFTFFSWSQPNSLGSACASHTLLHTTLKSDEDLMRHRAAIELHTQRFINDNATGVWMREKIVVPVIVHILYGNSSDNISEAQVLSQIRALNRDFNRSNADIDKVPALFKPLVADCSIEFRLAQRDPNGLPTNGIQRVATHRRTWNMSDSMKFEQWGGANAWKASDYLNIWVCQLNASILGFSSFPGIQATKDGIVIDTDCFGTMGSLNAYKMGRTCVHEVGHWLNLYHISGDSECGDDLVNDTPTQRDQTIGSNGYPRYDYCHNKSSIRMSMNFMDYVDDDQMYCFTNGQKARMAAQFAPNGFRASILQSRACESVQVLPCEQPLTPFVSNLSSKLVELQWLAAQGATAYRVAYSIAGKELWQYKDVTETRIVLSDLPTEATYQVKILPNCNAAIWSNIRTFKVPNDDPNLCSAQLNVGRSLDYAVPIATEKTTYSRLRAAGDENWFEVTVPKTAPHLKIVLSNLPADYDLRVYNKRGKLLALSNAAFNQEEQVTLNGQEEIVYIIRVTGYKYAYNDQKCYSLTVNTAASPFQDLSIYRQKYLLDAQDFVVYPNPASTDLTITADTYTETKTRIQIVNTLGKVCLEHWHSFSKNEPTFNLDITPLSSGVYSVVLLSGNERKAQRIVVSQ